MVIAGSELSNITLYILIFTIEWNNCKSGTSDLDLHFEGQTCKKSLSCSYRFASTCRAIDVELLLYNKLVCIKCAGSMGGSQIIAAQETLMLFLKSLPPGCYFNIVGFGSTYDLLFPE